MGENSLAVLLHFEEAQTAANQAQTVYDSAKSNAASAAATLHALNLAKARLAALEATQPTEPTTSTEPTKPTEPTTEPSVEPSTEPTGTEENTEEPADIDEDTDGGDVVTVVNTDEEPAAKSKAETPAPVTKSVAKQPAAKAPATAHLLQTGEKDAKAGFLAGILSLLAGISFFGFSFKKGKQEK